MKKVFFVQVPIKFEKLAQTELTEKWGLLFPNVDTPVCTLLEGGFELEANLSDFVKIIYYLKIPNRILLRLGTFKARDFPKLFKKISKINWNQFIIGQIPSVKISSHQSRLFDSRKIEKAFNSGIKKYYQANSPSKKNLEKINNLKESYVFLRFSNDECTVALDLTGERLSVRGYRKFIGKAPMRENLAAGIFYRQLLKHSEFLLVDPMCGSGTILIEALLFYQANTYRQYYFNFIPTLNNVTALLPELKKSSVNVIGFDSSDDALDACRKNLAALNIPDTFLKKEDLFSGTYCQEEKCIIISNLPYGLRLEKNQTDQEYFNKIKKQIIEKFGPTAFSLILPKEFSTNSKFNFKNGGFEVSLLEN